MNKVKEKTIKYFKDKLQFNSKKSDNKNCISKIQQLGLSNILHSELEKLDRTEESKYLFNIMYQEIYNKFLKQELINLINKTNEKNIKIIPLKGILLAEDIYDSIPERKISDIDILINIEDADKIFDICKELNYLDKNGNDLNLDIVSVFKRNTVYRPLHFEPIYKTINWTNKKILLPLEIHIDIMHKEIFNYSDKEIKKINREVMSRSKSIKYNGVKIFTLDLYDNIIFLLTHFVKHFAEPIMHSFYSGNIEINLQMNLLYDLALLIEKYKKQINWITFINRVKGWRLDVEIAFALKLINCIYPNTINYNVIQNLSYCNINYPSFLKQSCKILLQKNIDLSNLLCKEKCFNILVDTISDIRKDSLSVVCKYNNNWENEDNKYIIIDEYQDIKNKFKSYCILGKPSSSKDCSAKAYTWWDNKYLHLNIRVYDNNLILNDKLNLNNKQDLINISFDSMKRTQTDPFMKSLTIMPYKDEQKISLKVTDDITTVNGQSIFDIEWKKEEYNYDILIHNDGYTLNIDFLWTKLDIVPHLDMEIGMDILILDYDGTENTFHTIMAWSNTQPAWYDISGFGKIILK